MGRNKLNHDRELPSKYFVHPIKLTSEKRGKTELSKYPQVGFLKP